MSRGIRMSPKHGVNPCIPVCFWCGKQKNEIALLGRIDRKDSEAPMHAVINYEPCDECRAVQSQGVMLIEAVPFCDDQRPPITKDSRGKPVYPTGRHVVIKREAFQRIFGGSPNTERVCIDTELMDRFLNPS